MKNIKLKAMTSHAGVYIFNYTTKFGSSKKALVLTSCGDGQDYDVEISVPLGFADDYTDSIHVGDMCHDLDDLEFEIEYCTDDQDLWKVVPELCGENDLTVYMANNTSEHIRIAMVIPERISMNDLPNWDDGDEGDIIFNLFNI